MGAPSVRDVADLLDRAARESPERVALVETGVHAGTRRVTWAELEDEVGRVATGLGGSGIVAGHRVMLVLGNGSSSSSATSPSCGPRPWPCRSTRPRPRASWPG